LHRTGDNRQFVAADRRITNAYHCLFGPQIESNEFVRLADANRFGNAREVLEVRRIDGALISSDARWRCEWRQASGGP
jgi:hypothetical protein